VKLRSGLRAGDRSGVDVAVRLVDEAGVSAIAFHPRSAATQHKGSPDYALVRELVGLIDVPVIVSGGLDCASSARVAYEESGAAAVMIARGSFGYPWIFEELTGRRTEAPDPGEVADELLWVIDGAEEHLGPERAAHYLRKFYPWYLARMGIAHREASEFQQIDDLEVARRRVRELRSGGLVTA
jgi:tRNA-dihydrouridine synthase